MRRTANDTRHLGPVYRYGAHAQLVRESYFSQHHSLARGTCRNTISRIACSGLSVPSFLVSSPLAPAYVYGENPSHFFFSLPLTRCASVSLRSALPLPLAPACPTSPLYTHPRSRSPSRAPQSLPLLSRSVPWPPTTGWLSFCTRDDCRTTSVYYIRGRLRARIAAPSRFFRRQIGRRVWTRAHGNIRV